MKRSLSSSSLSRIPSHVNLPEDHHNVASTSAQTTNSVVQEPPKPKKQKIEPQTERARTLRRSFVMQQSAMAQQDASFSTGNASVQHSPSGRIGPIEAMAEREDAETSSNGEASAPLFFNGKTNYFWQGKGNVANGAVILLPQMHFSTTVRGNPAMQESLLRSQGMIFRTLVENKAQHVFSEDFPPNFLENFNQTYSRSKNTERYKVKMDLAINVSTKLTDNTSTLPLSDLLTKEEKDLMIQIGGGHLLSC